MLPAAFERTTYRALCSPGSPVANRLLLDRMPSSSFRAPSERFRSQPPHAVPVLLCSCSVQAAQYHNYVAHQLLAPLLCKSCDSSTFQSARARPICACPGLRALVCHCRNYTANVAPYYPYRTQLSGRGIIKNSFVFLKLFKCAFLYIFLTLSLFPRLR